MSNEDQDSAASSSNAPALSVPGYDHLAAPSPLAIVANLARRLLAGERASLLLPQHASGVLHIVSASGLSNAVIARTQVRVGDPVAGLVAETHQPLLGAEPVADRRSRAGRYRTGSFVSVPVPLVKGHYGVLSVADPRDRAAFHGDDMEALQGLAAFVAHYLSSAAFQKDMRRQMIQAREDERQRVARDLHDEAGHALTAAIFRLDLDALQLAEDPATARAALERARSTLLESAALLHDTAYALRPRILDDLGLLAALRSLIARAEEGGMQVTLWIVGVPERLDEARELAVLRVVQEALTNVRKHARAAHACVRLRFEATWLTTIVEDDGIGLADAAVPRLGPSSGLGLSGMRERVELLGGVFTIAERPHGGTRLVARFPLEIDPD